MTRKVFVGREKERETEKGKEKVLDIVRVRKWEDKFLLSQQF